MTYRQEGEQDKNNMPLDLWYGGIHIFSGDYLLNNGLHNFDIILTSNTNTIANIESIDCTPWLSYLKENAQWR